jgi:uncharacterized protein (UPF0333 family)
LVGITLIIGGVFVLVKNIKLIKTGVSMEADIIDVRKKKQTSTDSDGYTTTSDMYYPVYKYTYQGEEFTKESNFGVSNSRKYVKGNKLNIVFMPDTPEKSQVKGGMNLWMMPGILIFVGIVFLISYFAI